MITRTSVAMSEAIERELRAHLLRADGQEDICLARYRPSTGATRRTALVRAAILPEPGEREVHGNASIAGDYVLRAAALAQQHDDGLVLLHSHPEGQGWQGMSGPDRDAESAYANLAREITGMPLVGMTLAGGDGCWSARHWDRGVGTAVGATWCDNVRVVGERLSVSWNEDLVPVPQEQHTHARSVSCWGSRTHADLVRRSVLVVGAGSIGLDIAVRLAATGVTTIGLMDFDTIEEANLDRLIGATATDAWLCRSKVEVARRLVKENATALASAVLKWEHSICEDEGLLEALDFDQVFCCVDRPWPRAVLNAMAYRDLVPVIDGGIAVDVFASGEGMRNATWRSHIIRPGRACLACNGQLELGAVAADMAGLLDDPTYIAGQAGSQGERQGQNVAALSISAAAGFLAQYISFNVAPGGMGEPGPLQYVLSTHSLQRLHAESRPHCPVEALLATGDGGDRLTARHVAAEAQRHRRERKRLSQAVQIGRLVDDVMCKVRSRTSRASTRRLGR